MENILNQFNKNVTSLMENYLKNLIFKKGIANFTEDLVSEFANFGSKLTQYMIEYIEESIFKIENRKEKFESLEKDNRTLITIFGEINFKRRYYLDKSKNEKVYLLDKFLELKPKQRLLNNVSERLIENAIESTYEYAGKHAAYGVEISKQEVMNEIESLDLNKEFYPKCDEKKKVENIYIIADEDHVHLQKGGIEEPRIVIVYDNIVAQGKRIELQNKRHFGGIYKGRIDDLWEEVATYIDENYDIDYVKNVFILGDGASWIKTGKEWIVKSINVLDRFHMKKAINGIVGKETKQNREENKEYKRKIYIALSNRNFDEFRKICYEILSEEMEYGTRKRKQELMNYILNNQKEISNLYDYKEVLHGCSAEGHVSHVFAARLSSRPMGWKTSNVNNMSKLRLLKCDNITVKTILEKQEKIIDINEYKEIKAKVKNKVNEDIFFKPISIPIMNFGTKEEREYFKNILEIKAV